MACDAAHPSAEPTRPSLTFPSSKTFHDVMRALGATWRMRYGSVAAAGAVATAPAATSFGLVVRVGYGEAAAHQPVHIVHLGALDGRMLILVEIEKLMTSETMALVDSATIH